MRSIGASVMVGVGVFLLVSAALLRFYAPDRAEKTPLNLDITTVATGPAKLSAGGGATSSVELQATRTVRVDSTASNSNVVVVVETLCIVKLIDNPPGCVSANDPQHRLVSLTTDRVASDRRTGLAVNDPQYGEYVNSDTSLKHTGLSYKWPFGAQKKSYPFYDPASQQAPEAQYMREETVDGVDCYVYTATEVGLQVDVAPGIPGSYKDTRTVWVDPVTGTIIKGVEHQVRTLSDGSTALDTTLTFDAKSISYQANKAKDGQHKIDLLTVWLPLISLVLGLGLLVGGILVARSGRGRGESDAEGPSEPTPDGEPSYASSQT